MTKLFTQRTTEGRTDIDCNLLNKNDNAADTADVSERCL
jgi:hypothetical protein